MFSDGKQWLESEDDVLRDAVLPLIADKQRIHWETVFEEVKHELPGKTAASAKMRWNNYLSPQWEYGAIDDGEAAEIIENFEKHGFKFSLYDQRKRSTPILRRFIAAYIEKLHNTKTTETICAFLYRKLQDLIVPHLNLTTVEMWLAHCCEGDDKLRCVYNFIIYSHHHFLRETYGIDISQRNVSINYSKVYPRIINRKRVPMTPEEENYIQSLIDIYENIDRRSVSVSVTIYFTTLLVTHFSLEIHFFIFN